MPDAYTMEQQGVADQALSGDTPDPRMAATPMDPGAMAQLFGSDDTGQEPAPDDQADQAGGQDVDQGKLQSVLADPGLLMAVAQVLKTLGTGDDTDLVHVTEAEKAMLKQGGGQGTPNPTTGLLQYLKKDDTQAPDWYGMDPDARLAAIGGRRAVPPTWSDNWWMAPREATQGGTTRNMTGQDIANTNVAVTPSWGTAMNMAGLVTGMATGGPLAGIIGLVGKQALGSLASSIFGKDSALAGVGSFDTPGPRLSTEAQQRIAAAYDDAVNRNLPTVQAMNAVQRQIDIERAAMGGGPGGQTGGPGPGYSGGVGVDEGGNAYGTNIGGAGVSHNLAALGAPGAMAAADAARSFAAGGFGRAVMAGGGGRGPGGGGAGDGGGGSNRGGTGADGGAHGGPGGSNRSA